MTEPTNLERAMWAECALDAFNEQVSLRNDNEYYDPHHEVARDLIIDLCHFLNLDERAGCAEPEEIKEMLMHAFDMFEIEREKEDA